MCAEENDWPEPEPLAMAALMTVGGAQFALGGYVLKRYRPRWIPLWLSAILAWGTLCKYLICARCERYGQPCDFFYGGRYAALFFKRQPDREFGASGIIAEGLSGGIMQFLPLAACLGNKRLAALYLALNLLWQATLLTTACRKCVEYARDPWKRKYCPSYKMASLLFPCAQREPDRTVDMSGGSASAAHHGRWSSATSLVLLRFGLNALKK